MRIWPLSLLFIFGCSKEFKDQWYLKEWPGANVEKAWEITKGDPGLTLAIVDSPFDAANRGLGGPNGCLSRVYEFPQLLPEDQRDTEGTHGTDVAQVAASCADDASALLGVDQLSRVINLWYNKSTSTAFSLMFWAIGDNTNCNLADPTVCPPGRNPNLTPADVVNYSGTTLSPTKFTERRAFIYSPLLTRSGTVAVISAGNDARNADFRFPGAAEGFISVGATDDAGKAASFSNWGDGVDLMAPGKGIFTYTNGTTKSINGTSFSAPLVSGAIMLLKAAYPKTAAKRFNWKIARYLLQKTAVPMNCEAYCSDNYEEAAKANCAFDCCASDGSQHCTPGLIDVNAAVFEAQKGCPSVFLADSDQYFVRLKRDPGSGKWQGEITVSNRGCGSFAGDLSVQTIQSPAELFDVQKQVIETDASGNPAKFSVEFVAKSGASPPANFELNAIIRWNVDSKLTDELQIIAAPNLDGI